MHSASTKYTTLSAFLSVYEAGVADIYFPLMYEANREIYVAIQNKDVLAYLISKLQVETMERECLD